MSINNGESEIDTRTASELEQEGDHEGAAEQFIKNALGLEDEEAVVPRCHQPMSLYYPVGWR